MTRYADTLHVLAGIDLCPALWQGNLGEHFFVVKEGTFALRVLQADEGGTLQTVHRFAPRSEGDSCFGEIALVGGSTPYGGNIVARSEGTHEIHV